MYTVVYTYIPIYEMRCITVYGVAITAIRGILILRIFNASVVLNHAVQVNARVQFRACVFGIEFLEIFVVLNFIMRYVVLYVCIPLLCAFMCRSKIIEMGERFFGFVCQEIIEASRRVLFCWN